MDVLIRRGRTVALAAILAALTPVFAAAQRLPARSPDPPEAFLVGEASAPAPLEPFRPAARWADRAWVRPVASLIVPGGGQLLAGQERGLAYLAAEVWLIARALALDSRARREREAYRALAYQVARQPFAAIRVDGPFEYYESMEKYVESGAYDRDPGINFEPELDTATFNGSVWLLARRTFLANPDSLPAPDHPTYLAALGFYRGRAARPEFQWSWRDARLEQDVFRQSINASDESFRAVTNYLGALVANHLVSAVDALIATRRSRVPLAPSLVPDPGGMGIGLWLRHSF